MPVLIGILTVIGVIAVILWRIYVAAQRARQIGEAVGDARRFVRRTRWKGRANERQAQRVDDPREAAAAMMVALAQSDGALTDKEQTAICERMRAHFEADAATATDLLGRGRWLARDIGDLNAFMRRMLPPIQARCTLQEQRDLVAMVTAVAEAEGPAGPIQQDAVGFVSRQLGLGPGGV